MPTEIPPNGNPGKWPTADAIDNRIKMSGDANGRVSPLAGMGDVFIEYGHKYGINPGVVVAILQRESQLGSDGSVLPAQCNNFGGITQRGTAGYCEAASGIHGREWAKFRNARDGLEQTFILLNSSLYRSTGGRLEDVIEKYAPAYENDHDEIFMTFAAVGSNLGIVIDRNTNIYTNAGTGGGVSTGGGNLAGGISDSIGDMLEGFVFRGILIGIGVVFAYQGVKRVI